MRLFSSLTFAQLLCFAAALKTGTVLSSDIDTFVADTLAGWNSQAGVAIAVVRQDGQGGWSVETKGYGNARADGTKVTPDTLFSIGSESKLFNILATGLLISNQSLPKPIDWTTKISTILPEWKLMDPVASSGSSIIDLMSHRTGMPRHDVSLGYSDTVPGFIKRMKYLKPSAEFRSKFQYNNLMYTVLSYLPTALVPSKPSFAQYVHDNIFSPLGMNSSTYSFEVANATGRLADAFGREGDPTVNPITAPSHAMPFWLQAGGKDGTTFASGPGGVISSINDIAIWLQMLLSNGINPATNASVIPSKVLNMVTTGATVWPFTENYPEFSPATYGGGQYKTSYRGHDLFEHSGDVQGFHSIFTRFPYEGAGVAVLSNDDLFYIRDTIRYRIIDELLGLDPVDWNTRNQQVAVGTALVRASLVSTPRPANATPPTGGFPSLVGKYSNPGYTSVELCLIAPPPSTASHACSTLAKTLNSTFPTLLGDYSTPTLAFTWDRVAARYMKLAHFNGNVFNLTGWTDMPTGNASSPVWAYDAGFSSTNVVFGPGGFGFVGGVWGAQDSPDPQGKTAEQKAEVWFDKSYGHR
ncbi:beta-lactamase domain-containing protein [Favolaschia claudopus]|uniref:Beta-lactamase domain-containing protein n=1 Tax=Favolaschia claudopus TaxID=2862362 RepID=A0AAW0DW38_9AGAR